MTTYGVEVRWDVEDEVWYVELLDDPRCHTYGRNLVEVDQNAREVVALWHNVEIEDVALIYDFALPQEASSLVDDVQQLREDSRRAQEALGPKQEEAARRLVEELGLTYRDAARLLGVSHQRIAQLVRSRG